MGGQEIYITVEWISHTKSPPFLPFVPLKSKTTLSESEGINQDFMLSISKTSTFNTSSSPFLSLNTMQGSWKLVKVGDHSVEGNTIVKVENNNINYTYGNSSFGPIHIDGDTVKIGPLASTLMYIELDPPESLVQQSFSSARRFKIEGDRLTLLGEDGKVTAELQRST